MATLCVLVGVLALGSVSASAYLKHEYISQVTGTPEGVFKVGCSSTIDPATQDLYVAEYGNNAIDVFEPAGIDGYTYKSRISAPSGLFSSLGGSSCGIAISDITGDVYVTTEIPSSRVFVFGASGDYLEEINGSTTPNGSFNGRINVAVDQSSGDVYIAASVPGVVDKLNSKNEYQSQFSVPGAEGLAVDSSHDLYVGENGDVVQKFNSSDVKISEIAGTSEPSKIAVDSVGNVYVSSHADKGVVNEYSPSGVFEGQTSGTPSKHFFFPGSVAVNAAGDLYVSVEDSVDIFGPSVLVPDVSTEAPSKLTGTTATLNGTVNPDGTQITSCEFEYGPTPAYGQAVPCEQAPVGSSPTAVTANLTGLHDGVEYHYRLVATNANGDSKGEPASEDQSFFTLGARIQEESFSEVRLHSATVNAKLNPEGSTTTYAFEYGTSEAYGSTTPTKSAGAGSETVEVSAALGGSTESLLQPETTYHFRIVAINANGTSYGPDTTFTTQTNQIELPDGRGYEMVSAIANADGNVYEPLGPGAGGSGGFSSAEATSLPMRASANGNAVEYVADPPASGGSGSVGNRLGNEYVATRVAGGGWSAVDLETPGLDKAPFEALLPNELSNSGTSAVPASTDRLSEVGGKLYESIGGRLSLVSVLPDGKTAPGASFGGVGGDLSHVISADGSRVFWAESEVVAEHGGNAVFGSKALYVRENGTRTVQIDATQGPGLSGGGRFWTASSDGSRVFFTDCSQLTDQSTAVYTKGCEREAAANNGVEVIGNDLYEYNVDTGLLVDLTVDASDPLSADVQGVIGVSEDGSYVYFVAGGVLSGNENAGKERALPQTCIGGINGGVRGTPCNLYVLHDGATTFIAALTSEDLYGFQAQDLSASSAERSAEVTPDGQHVVFKSNVSLTGYVNSYTETADRGGGIVETFVVMLSEAYVYDAATAHLSCVSCNPTGVPPTSGSSVSLPASFNGSFMHRWISEDGSRVFFESNEGLVAQDTNGKQDVYEWEREGSGSCAPVAPARRNGGCIYLLSGGTSTDGSYLLDASANGNDVFVISRAQLSPLDSGGTFEVYDVRVGASQPLAGQVCSGTGCQGLPAAPPPFATPSSVTFNGVGNFSSPPLAVVKPAKRAVKCTKPKKLSHGKCINAKRRARAHKAKRASNDRRAGR
jgi:hypothetical protein